MPRFTVPTVAAALALSVTFASAQNNQTRQQQTQQRNTQQQDTLLKATLLARDTSVRGMPGGSGEATITLRPTSREVCYNLVFRGVNGVQAHIHKAPVGETGHVAVPFMSPKDSVSLGCARVDPAVVADLMMHPGSYYVDVHSSNSPHATIRGQLERIIAPRNRVRRP